MSEKEKRITRMSQRRPFQRRPTSPYRDFIRMPIQPIDVDTSQRKRKGCKHLPLIEDVKEIKKSSLTRWLKKNRDTYKILKDEDGTIYLFENEDAMRKYLVNLDFDRAVLNTDFLNRPILVLKPRDIRHGRRFVMPTRPLNPQEVEEYRNFGLIPLDKKKGDWTRGYEIHLDKTTIQQLLEKQKYLNEKSGQNLNFSEIVRLMILEGLKASKEN